MSQRRQQQQQPAVVDATAVSGGAEEGGGGEVGFLSAALCCTVCHEMKPASAFYASNLRRSVFYCKQCSAAKSRAAKRPAAAAAAPARSRDTSVAADNLLDRLRRMCARPQECGLRQLLQQPISLDFDVRVARMLLPVWNDQSALSLSSSQQQQQQQQEPSPSSAPSQALRLLPWFKQDALPLQPWEVIPLTRAEARRLCAIPLHLWERCLQPECVAAINSKLADLKRMLLDKQPQQQQPHQQQQLQR